MSASTNALGYYFPYSTLSLNNPANYCHQPTQFNNNSSQYLFGNQQQHQQRQSTSQVHQELPLINSHHHHHSMINLNYSNTNNNQVENNSENNSEPLLNENSPSPTMSNSPVPEPPAPPLNPHCARCRFTSSISATVASNGNLHRQQICGSNPHLHQQAANINYGSSTTNNPPAVPYPGELLNLFH